MLPGAPSPTVDGRCTRADSRFPHSVRDRPRATSVPNERNEARASSFHQLTPLIPPHLIAGTQISSTARPADRDANVDLDIGYARSATIDRGEA